jgi:retron-type reverse transcriptase
MAMNIGWIVDADVSGFFDNLDHRMLREIIKRRVKDGGILRFIGKWLNAGVVEGETLSYPEKGTPQGGVISPMISNIFLHTVLDEWYTNEVKPRLKGRSFLIRFADDCAPRAYMKIYMCGAAYEMRVGPSEPTCRSRLQTASSCAG